MAFYGYWGELSEGEPTYAHSISLSWGGLGGSWKAWEDLEVVEHGGIGGGEVVILKVLLEAFDMTNCLFLFLIFFLSPN